MPLPKPSEALRDYAQADLLDALAITRAADSALDAYQEGLVRYARRQGHTWAEIARALGVTRQAAHRRFRQLEPRDGSATDRGYRP